MNKETIELRKYRIRTTVYPNSISVQQALLQVWNECEQNYLKPRTMSKEAEEYLKERSL